MDSALEHDQKSLYKHIQLTLPSYDYLSNKNIFLTKMNTFSVITKCSAFVFCSRLLLVANSVLCRAFVNYFLAHLRRTEYNVRVDINDKATFYEIFISGSA